MKSVFIKPEGQEIQHSSEFSKFIDDLRELLIIEENTYWNILDLISSCAKRLNKLDNKYTIELFIDSISIKSNLIAFILRFTCRCFTSDKIEEIRSLTDFNDIFNIENELTEVELKKTLWIN